VWTVESEIAYLSAFTNSVMVELSRLDAITSNKMKSDFISSISRKQQPPDPQVVLKMADEFRSPLHGILASAEFLRDSTLDDSQIEFISTIQNCSGTLLVQCSFRNEL
jgi:signal transduction histidine kinase